MRKPHYLRPNKAAELPVQVVFFDTETTARVVDEDTTQAVLDFGWAYYIRRHRGLRWTPGEWFRFNYPECFWEWVERHALPKRKLYLIAHNLAFDATVVQTFKELRERGWKIDSAILDDPPTVIRYRKDKRTILLMDSLNHFRMPLNRLGQYAGMFKLPMPAPGAPQEQWDVYCKRDVVILASTFMEYWKMIREWDLGNFQYTLPAQAFTAFRHRFMREPIFIDGNERALDLARKSYMGGRTECYFIGKVPTRLHCVDINSLYPHMMWSQQVPLKLLTVTSRVKPAELEGYMASCLAVADVTLKTDFPRYPLRHAGRTLFPVGTFRTVLTTPELREALQRGQVRTVHGSALYEGAIVFDAYVTYFWRQRRQAEVEGNTVLAFLCKLYLNTLYGKFGQTGRRWVDFAETDEDDVGVEVVIDADEKRLRKFRRFAGLIQEQVLEGESRESSPAIAAHITAYGRTALWALMQRARHEHVYYCDTDSMMVDDQGLASLEHLIAPGELGKLKVEWTSDNVVIRGAKDYTIDDQRRTKGIKTNAVEGPEGVFVQDRFRGFRGMLRDRDLDRQLITRVTKRMGREYWKGTVQEDGTVLPLRFPLSE